MFKEISAKEIKGNLIEMISKEWMLISAGDKEKYNMMTASWGFAGEIWGEDSVCIFVRPQRYTLEFLNSHKDFSLTFYGDNKDIHRVCGSKSGREVNKTEQTGLTPCFEDDTVYFDEARIVLLCEKQYVDVIKPENFIDETAKEKWYPDSDYHYMFIGKIKRVLVKE